MTMPTLLDIAKRNGSDQLVGLVEEASKAHPEITLFPSRPIKGLNYRTRVRTALPTAGFRNYGEGVAASKSSFENRLVECYILNPRWECDKAIADRAEDGPEAYINEEGAGMLEAAFQSVASQIYYGPGTGGDAKGFPGFLQSYDATNMVVDAGGTTATTGSSVWGVRFGSQDAQLVVGNNGAMELSSPTLQRVLDGSSNPFTAYCQEVLAYIGMQVGAIKSIGRIKKLTADSGKGLTDALLYDLYGKFPAGKPPQAFFLSLRSLMQLTKSRTATSPTGAPPPVPTDWFGIPLHVTDAIINTEALTL